VDTQEFPPPADLHGSGARPHFQHPVRPQKDAADRRLPAHADAEEVADNQVSPCDGATVQQPFRPVVALISPAYVEIVEDHGHRRGARAEDEAPVHDGGVVVVPGIRADIARSSGVPDD